METINLILEHDKYEELPHRLDKERGIVYTGKMYKHILRCAALKKSMNVEMSIDVRNESDREKLTDEVFDLFAWGHNVCDGYLEIFTYKPLPFDFTISVQVTEEE